MRDVENEVRLVLHKIASMSKLAYAGSDSAMTVQISDSDHQNTYEIIESLAQEGLRVFDAAPVVR